MEQPQYGGDECFRQPNGERPQSLKTDMAVGSAAPR